MGSTSERARRGLFGAFAVTAAGGAAFVALAVPGGLAAPSATAALDPCAASEVAKTLGSVATSTGNYLDAHPETNTALTTISKQQAGPASLAALKTYFDANPQAGKDMQQLQQPLVVLSSRCKLPLTLPQLMGLMQGAQSQADALQGAASGSLPGALGSAQTVGIPGAGLPASRPPASVGRQGAGPLPGPATTAATAAG
ncbi:MULTISPECIES: hemophore [unclassified Mycolicibacterium]|uniref:hemophore n=1 Tax=unclassified Mycolicibacterium TaxID=2636767 RepID=UPI001F4C0E4F|nr:hemophore [Mycolicibacterium sp. YH-1]UNB52323.1 hemophore [Mycolicibacterium sp. YH-1]